MSTSPPGRDPETDRVSARARARWLIPGGALALILVVMFVTTASIDAPAATIGILITAIWFAAMIASAFAVRSPRVHSRVQFGLMLAMSLAGLGVLYVIFLSARG